MAGKSRTQSRRTGSRKRTANKASQPKFIIRLLQRTAIVAAVIGCTVLVIGVQSDIAEKENELRELEEQISEYEAANEDLARIIDSGDTDSYMEMLAREEYGYAYPDEFRFYDTSRN